MENKEKKKQSNDFSNLRSPVALIKKRSGPLDEALEKLHNEDALQESSPSTLPIAYHSSYIGNKLRRCSIKEKKRERWLLTRKTWRYMADAGRKLIPEGNPDNMAQIEAHFQSVCASEPRFLLWRRKASYPGATLSSKRRSKLLSRHSSHQRYINNQDRVIELLQTYLNLRDTFNKTTTLLGTKTIRPDQTSSPSSQRPHISTSKNAFLHQPAYLDLHTELFNRLKILSESILLGQEDCTELDLGNISTKILEDKTLLKKVYSTLKKKQLHRALHSMEASKSVNFQKYNRNYRASSLSRNPNITSLDTKSSYNQNALSHDIMSQKNDNNLKVYDTRSNTLISEKNPSPINLVQCDISKNLPNVPKPHSLNLDLKNSRNFSRKIERVSSASLGTQTNFIQLSELKHLAEEYKSMFLQNSSVEKDPQNCRKSSIDNEDISQSVSDTIKRYLKMARKKSVHDTDTANKFRSINYDTALRNIKAKGEINPPGMNDGLNKATQTLDAWPLIALDFIRGNNSFINLKNAHIQWKKSEDERKEMALEWRKSQKLNGALLDSTSAPTSPSIPPGQFQDKSLRSTSTGLLYSSSHFLSNIWHGHGNYNNTTGASINTAKEKTTNLYKRNATTSNMQKSKSLSNVGQFVTTKILRSRSKSQNIHNVHEDFVPIPSLKWHPADNFLWVAENGERFLIEDALLIKLSKFETDFLKEIILEKIKELNIGNITELKRLSEKRRIVPKKKSLTTGFFDIGKKDVQSGREMELFGVSLELCLERDTKRNIYSENETRSKCSLISMFRGSRSNPGSVIKLSDNVRSCESLPTKSLENEHMDTCEREQSKHNYNRPHQDLMVPIFVYNCIDHLEENGLQKVGLFRVSSSKKRIKQLREEFDNGNGYLRIPANTCPHDVATLLKEFLRDLPEPLLCMTLYSTFLETQRIRNRRLQLEAISHLIRLLPIPHRDTLYVLLVFLAKVAAHSDDVCDVDGNCLINGNKMDSSNLATVFAPNILRNTTLSLDKRREQQQMSDAINVVRTMIDHYEEMFKVPAELLDVLYAQMLDVCPDKLYELISTKAAAQLLQW
ncbi:hypothetical protein KR054_005178 [Drosophila jambulina]|nr:hypothetical protein KR054_005178 [Drosophila jambulina]